MGKKNQKKNYAVLGPQLARLHAIVRRIQRGDYPSQTILAKEMEMDGRTIQRDLDFLRDRWGVPLVYDVHRYGYYFTERVGKFPMVPISEGELVSVFVAQKALKQYQGTPFEEPLKVAFEKLVSSLKGEISVAWADLDSAISFRGIEANPADVEMFQKLSSAVRNRNEIEFEYFKLGADGPPLGNAECRMQSVESEKKLALTPSFVRSTTEGRPALSPGEREKHAGGRGGKMRVAGDLNGETRKVRPYHLACVGNQWYLFGYDLVRRDIRKFVPARMRGLKVLERKFERPKDFSVDRVLAGSFGVFSGGKTMAIKIRFDSWAAQLVRERQWHRSQRIRDLRGGGIELSLELSSFVEIVPWILSWGIHARALGPRKLVREVAEVVKRLGCLYGKS